MPLRTVPFSEAAEHAIPKEKERAIPPPESSLRDALYHKEGQGVAKTTFLKLRVAEMIAGED
jgi:hypothetical protein